MNDAEDFLPTCPLRWEDMKSGLKSSRVLTTLSGSHDRKKEMEIRMIMMLVRRRLVSVQS